MKRRVNLFGQRGLRLPAKAILVSALLVPLLLGAIAPVATLAQSSMYQVYVTDVGAAQFTVTWVTDAATAGHVDWGTTTALGNTASDPNNNTTMHRVVVSGLSPITDYYFQVRSDATTDNNNGDYYLITTGDSIDPPIPGKIVWGYIKQSDGSTLVPGALVYLQLQNNDGSGDAGTSQWVTTQAEPNGVWSYDLNNVRTADGSAYFSFSDGGDNLRLVSQGAGLGVEGEDGAERIESTPTSYDAQLVDATLAGTLNGSPIVGHDHFGESWTASGTGLSVNSTATTGATVALLGRNYSTSGYGILGQALATTGYTYGLSGNCDSTQCRGLVGYATAATGETYGVLGRSGSNTGVGVYGYADNTTSGNMNIGVLGQTNSPDGWAGRFETTAGNGVYISVPAAKAGLNVASGTKNAVVPADDGARLLYAEESTEVWFADYGFGQLQDGSAVIAIDPLFAQTVNLEEPYHVFVEEYGPDELYVSQRTPEWFEVRAHKRNADTQFSYRLVARRLGYEGHRLERAPWADDDPNLYPERRAEWEAKSSLPEPVPLEEVAPPPEAP